MGWLLTIFMFVVAAVGTVATVTHNARNDEAQKSLSTSYVGNMMVYRNAVATYAAANPTVTGEVANSALNLPAWFTPMANVRNRVQAGQAFVYFAAGTIDKGQAYAMMKQADNSILVGLRRGSTLYNPIAGTTAITLPTQIPEESVVFASTAAAAAVAAPADCNITSGQGFAWAVGANNCTANAGAAISIPSGTQYGISDVTPSVMGSAAFACNNGSLSSTASAGATCSTTPPVDCTIAASQNFSWTVSGLNCSAPAPVGTTIASGTNYSITDSTPTQTGAAAFACTNGVIAPAPNAGATCVSAPLDCTVPANTPRSWSVGSSNCSRSYTTTLTVSHGSSRVFNDTTAPDTGTADFQCNNGVLSNTPNAGATCATTVTDCTVTAGQPFNWTVSGQNCSATAASNATITTATNYTITDSTPTVTGTASFACSNGSLSGTANAGATCVAAPTNCSITAGQTFNWTVSGQNCSAPAPASTTITTGSNYSITDSTPTVTGAAAFACTNGTLAGTPNAGATCVAAPTDCNIPGGTVRTWNVGGNICTQTQATAATVPHNALRQFTDATAPTTGVANYRCNSGTLSSTEEPGATCVTAASPCTVTAGEAFAWNVSTNNCAANAPANASIPSGTTYAISDSTPSVTGDANFTCTNGVLSSTANADKTCITTISPCTVNAGQTFSWNVGGQNCTASAPSAATVASGSSYSIADNVQNSTGNAQFQCVNGTMTATANAGATCETRCQVNAGTSRSWWVSGSTCDATTSSVQYVNHGSTLNFNDSTAPTTGTGIYLCQNGTLLAGYEAGTTCTTAPTCGPAPSDPPQTAYCPAGTYGSWSQTRTYSSVAPPTCWTPNAWSPATAPVGACTACPAASTQSQTQWVAYTDSCPAGYTGQRNMEREQTQSRSLTYSCPAGTTFLPAATPGSWGAWSNTGATREVSNTCEPNNICSTSPWSAGCAASLAAQTLCLQTGGFSSPCTTNWRHPGITDLTAGNPPPPASVSVTLSHLTGIGANNASCTAIESGAPLQGWCSRTTTVPVGSGASYDVSLFSLWEGSAAFGSPAHWTTAMSQACPTGASCACGGRRVAWPPARYEMAYSGAWSGLPIIPFSFSSPTPPYVGSVGQPVAGGTTLQLPDLYRSCTGSSCGSWQNVSTCPSTWPTW